MRVFILLLISGFLFSCSSQHKNHKVGEQFFDTFSKRKELKKALSYYSDDFEYEDVVFGTSANDATFLYNEIYDWGNPNFNYPTGESIELDKIVANDSAIVASGRTLRYSYKGREVRGVNFVIWLDLDKSGRITRQTDWYDYEMEDIIEVRALKKSLEIE